MSDETFYYRSHLCHQVGVTTSYAGGSAHAPERYRRISPTSRTLVEWPGLATGPTRLERCPYCASDLLFEVGGQGEYMGVRATGDERKLGGTCGHCNWWYVQRKWHEDNDEVDHIRDDLFTYRTGVHTASAWGSQNVMSMARYSPIAVDSRACASSTRPI